MRQIADWLEKLGLGQYARRFNENGIDLSVLPDLTDQDLEKLGVLLGHRRKLLRAIADLKDVEKSTPADAIATVAHAVPHPLDSAERRQVTVMFSDLVGSTELAARMDPEDLRDVISAYQQCVSGTVQRYDGFVAKYMGDGVLVYFGYPRAHEDDTDRAVRAGLELIAAVTALKSRASLQSRVGIATGLVVVGDLIGSGDAQERGIVGETPNLAARLQGIAQPNTVVIADGTRRLLGNLFELQDLGPTDLKGIAGPVRAWAALRASSVESRFEALHTTGLIALVGREEESELLLRRWSRAKTGEGQVVLLSGEAGIGKSRLTAALLERAAGLAYDALAVPASLHASLMARLDRLGPAKEVAQIGSAIGREFSHALLASVARKSEAELGSALDRLVQAGLLSRQGVPPQASYLFKHALVQDAAYGTMLREPRRALHARIAETLESQFAETAESRPEILAHHCTEAGLIEKAAGLWGKAGQRSLDRSALAEAAAQFTRALEQIATLPGTPALRREQIKLQVALITPLIHVKGYAAAETKAAAKQARLLIEQAEALGEPSEEPLLLFSVLYAFWVANFGAFNGDVCRDLAAQFLALAEKQRATVPLMIGHRIVGSSLLFTGDIAEGRGHFDQALALYDPAEHRSLATRFGQDTRMTLLSYRSLALWLLGCPEAALSDADEALKNSREIGQAATLMFALRITQTTYGLCGNRVATAAHAQELVALAEEKGAPFWKAFGMMNQGSVLALTGRASGATEMLISGIAAYRTTGATIFLPFYLPHLARAHAELGQFEEAWRCIGQAMRAAETAKEKWCEAEIHRTAGEITLLSPAPDAAKAQAHFERALAIARAQQAKSWELRAATSLARLWRDQGKRQQARELLAPIYGWFSEGFDTRDLKEAKALLDELHD